MEKVNLERTPGFYHGYINMVTTNDLIAALQEHVNDLTKVLEGISTEKWDYRYAEGKWSIKELVQHLIDAERIFNYRALCLARGESNPLPGFDENKYAANSKAFKRTKRDLIKELQLVQETTLKLFLSFDEEQLGASGIVNGSPNYVKAIGFIIVGHALHHKAILQERYIN